MNQTESHINHLRHLAFQVELCGWPNCQQKVFSSYQNIELRGVFQPSCVEEFLAVPAQRVLLLALWRMARHVRVSFAALFASLLTMLVHSHEDARSKNKTNPRTRMRVRKLSSWFLVEHLVNDT